MTVPGRIARKMFRISHMVSIFAPKTQWSALPSLSCAGLQPLQSELQILQSAAFTGQPGPDDGAGEAGREERS